SLLQKNLKEMKETLEDPNFQKVLPLQNEQARGAEEEEQPSRVQQEEQELWKRYPYPRPEKWRTEAALRVGKLSAMIDEWQRADEQWPTPPLFVTGAPEPI